MNWQTPVVTDTIPREKIGDIEVVSPLVLAELLKSILTSRLDKDDTSHYQFVFDRETYLTEVSACDVGTPLYDAAEVDRIIVRYGLALKYMTSLVNLKFDIISLMFSNDKGSALLVFKYTTPSGLIRELRYIMDETPALIFTDDFLHDLEHIPNREGNAHVG